MVTTIPVNRETPISVDGRYRGKPTSGQSESPWRSLLSFPELPADRFSRRANTSAGGQFAPRKPTNRAKTAPIHKLKKELISGLAGRAECVYVPRHLRPVHRKYRGEVPEWLNGTVSKTVVRVTVPRVRIPLSPPYLSLRYRLRLLERMATGSDLVLAPPPYLFLRYRLRLLEDRVVIGVTRVGRRVSSITCHHR